MCRFQLNNITNGNATVSTSICNECVLNIANFYTFKKKILEAQDFLGALSVVESTDEKSQEIGNYIAVEGTEDLIQILEEEHLRPSDENETEAYIVESDSQQSSNESSEQIQSVDENQVKRSRLSDKNKSTSSKRSKTTTDSNEKVTIQMNECLICDSVLDDIHQLDNHITSHKSEINCKICLRVFARYSNLKRHFMSVHSKPKPFQCDLCGLGFSFSVNLQTHAELHYSGKIRMK